MRSPGEVYKGVQGPEAPGTPSSFSPPVLANEATLDTLEFDAALTIVATYAAGPLGAARIRARRPTIRVEEIQHELALCRECLTLVQQGDGLEVVAVPEADRAFDRLRIDGAVLDGTDLLAIAETLVAAERVARELHRIAERAPTVATLRVPVPEASIARRLARSIGPDGAVLDTASPGVAEARRAIHVQRERLVRRLESILRTADAAAVPAGATVTVRDGRYVIPVRKDARARPQGIVHDESGSAGTLFIEPTDAIELGNALREAILAEQREVLAVLRELTALLRPLRETLVAAHAMCVAADDVAARARYARSVGAEVPSLGAPEAGCAIREGRHPLLLARGIEAVPFDLSLEPDERTLLVSGPNAGGKTVLLKTVGLAQALVQSGVIPPVGAGSHFPVLRRLFADIGDHQSIAADLSTFSAHVALLRDILTEADAGTLVLFDELGSGTDPAEGAALAWATLETLTDRGARTIATTHLGALKRLAAEVPGVVNGSLEFDALTVSPTYRFQKGVPGRSYGLAIARRLGVDPAVLARAEHQVPEGERALDRLLAEVEARDQALRSREATLAERDGDAEVRLAALALKEQALVTRERDLRVREKELDQQARRQAREYLPEARRIVEQALTEARAAHEDAQARQARRVVEEGLASLDRSAKEVAAEPRRGAPTVAEGARVRLATGGLGRVERLRDDGRLEVHAGALRLVVPPDAVLEVLPTGPRGASTSSRSASEPAMVEAASPMEIDLRGYRADEAEAATVAAVDGAVLADYPFLRIIHGKGTGALRERVHEVLRADRRVRRFGLAPATEGGSGATIVEFT